MISSSMECFLSNLWIEQQKVEAKVVNTPAVRATDSASLDPNDKKKMFRVDCRMCLKTLKNREMLKHHYRVCHVKAKSFRWSTKKSPHEYRDCPIKRCKFNEKDQPYTMLEHIRSPVHSIQTLLKARIEVWKHKRDLLDDYGKLVCL